MSFLTLKVISPNTDGTNEIVGKINTKRIDNISNLEYITAEAPVIGQTMQVPNDLYKLFESFMMNPTYIRYGDLENVVTWRLVDRFNKITRQNISFNATFPKLMRQFMNNHPQYNIQKKTQKDGVIYFKIGLSTDETPQPKTLSIDDEYKKQERNEKRRERYAKHAAENRQLALGLKDEILRRTNWTEIQFDQLIRLKLIPVFKNDTNIDIESIIIVANGRIIEFIYDKFNYINRAARKADYAVHQINKAIEHDKPQSEQQNYPVYTNRLKLAESPPENDKNETQSENKKKNYAYSIGNRLQQRIDLYNGVINNLPHFDHIVYPDIQSLSSLAIWLKNHTLHKVRKNMAKDQEEFEDDETPQAVDWDLDDDLYNSMPEDNVKDHNDINSKIIVDRE
ncbi:Hypothetical protein HVR_LOCUS633 [uncultured virus]|nr:Hypothetical protein HVR_LOCUS633 [uncultured virus]